MQQQEPLAHYTLSLPLPRTKSDSTAALIMCSITAYEALV